MVTSHKAQTFIDSQVPNSAFTYFISQNWESDDHPDNDDGEDDEPRASEPDEAPQRAMGAIDDLRAESDTTSDAVTRMRGQDRGPSAAM